MSRAPRRGRFAPTTTNSCPVPYADEAPAIPPPPHCRRCVLHLGVHLVHLQHRVCQEFVAAAVSCSRGKGWHSQRERQRGKMATAQRCEIMRCPNSNKQGCLDITRLSASPLCQAVAVRTRVEVDGGARKAQEQRVAAVGIGDVEGGVRHERLHVRRVAGHVAGCLQAAEERGTKVCQAVHMFESRCGACQVAIHGWLAPSCQVSPHSRTQACRRIAKGRPHPG